MCVVSMVADHYQDKWRWVPPQITVETVSRAEFEQLKREVADLKALLKRAKQYDTDTDQPDCETDEKLALLRRIAEGLGVDLDEALR